MIFKYYREKKLIINKNVIFASLMKVKKRDRQIKLVRSNITEACTNGALQITFYQKLNNKL